MAERDRKFKISDESKGTTECEADCPHCLGGACSLEMGHPGLHHCASCGNTWEELQHSVSIADL
jgi:hypothetical protein